MLASPVLQGGHEIKNEISWLGVLAHAVIPALWEAEAGGSPEVGSLRQV